MWYPRVHFQNGRWTADNSRFETGALLPLMASVTLSDPIPVNFDVLSLKGILEFYDFMVATRGAVILGLLNEERIQSTMLHPEVDATDLCSQEGYLMSYF